MTHAIYQLVQQYGLIGVFIGCVAEGESIAVLAGFFAHQAIFVPWQAFLATFLGAFLGDTFFYLFGRSFSNSRFVKWVRAKPGFERALQLVRDHPAKFVILNRYTYGFRLIGGVASGVAGIPIAEFVVLNSLASLIWAAIFNGLGYFFGAGAEQVIGTALEHHHKLLVGLAIGVVVAVIGAIAAHRYAKRGQA